MKDFLKNKKYLCALLLLLCVLVTIPAGVTLAKYYAEYEYSFDLNITNAPPVLAKQRTWFDNYKNPSSLTTADITSIKFSGTAPSTYTSSWDASAAQDGSVICYRNGSTLTLVGDKTLGVYANPDSSKAFSTFKIQAFSFDNYDTSLVTNMSNMYLQCSSLTSFDDSKINTSNVTDMSSMFKECTAITSLSLTHFDTQKVRSMTSMFNQCTVMKSVDVSSFDTGNVGTMDYMFRYCYVLTSLSLNHFDVQNVTTMQSMFNTCKKLSTLGLSTWNTASLQNMDSMFYQCQSLTTLDLEHFDTAEVTTINQTFYNCTKLSTLKISTWNTDSLTNMRRAFAENNKSSSLKSLDLSPRWVTKGNETYSSWNVSNVTSLVETFKGSLYLDKLYLGDWNLPANVDTTNIFKDFAESASGSTGDVYVATQEQCDRFETFPYATPGSHLQAYIYVDSSLVLPESAP